MPPNSTHIGNRKLSAWIGSILFHTALFLLTLCWFSLSSVQKSAPGERFASGSIVLQSSGGIRQPAESAPTDSQAAETELAAIETEPFSKAPLSLAPANPVLAPGQNQNTPNTASDSANAVSEALEGIPGPRIGNQTGEATVQIFGAEGKGSKFMYVFDRSGSMHGKPIQMAKAELIRSLDSLGDSHQFNIIFYSGKEDLSLWQPGRRLMFASETNKINAIRYVEGITATGGTWHFDPLKEAILHRPDVIFFLTDGESHDDLTAAQLQEIERLNSRLGRGAQINVIQFGSSGMTDSPSRSLQHLAEQNHGKHLYINVLLWK